MADQNSSSAAPAPPALDQESSSLLKLPNELLYKIGRNLLIQEWQDEVDSRSLRCCSQRLAEALRPLAWTIHHFDEEETYGLKLSTRQLQDDVELQGFVRRAVWDLPAVMPMIILPRLPNLHSLQVNAEVSWDSAHVGVTGVLSALPALRRLALHDFDSAADSSFSFASSAPSIRHLDLIDCDAFEVEGGELLEELCTNSSLPAVIELLPTLRALDLSSDGDYDCELHALNEELSADTTDTVWAIQDLTIRNDYYTEALDLLRPHQRFSNLRKLTVDVERTLAQRDDLGAGNQLKLASVIELTLLEWRFFTYNFDYQEEPADIVQAFLKPYPNVRTLTIEGKWNLTDAALASRSPTSAFAKISSVVDHLRRHTKVEELAFVDTGRFISRNAVKKLVIKIDHVARTHEATLFHLWE